VGRLQLEGSQCHVIPTAQMLDIADFTHGYVPTRF